MVLTWEKYINKLNITYLQLSYQQIKVNGKKLTI